MKSNVFKLTNKRNILLSVISILFSKIGENSTSGAVLHVIFFNIVDEVFRCGILGSVVHLTYAIGHDVVKALTSDVRSACLYTVDREGPGLERLKSVALQHLLINRVNIASALLTGNAAKH